MSLLLFYLQYIFEYYDFYISIYYSGTVLIYQYLFLLNTVRTLFTFCNREEERINIVTRDQLSSFLNPRSLLILLCC